MENVAEVLNAMASYEEREPQPTLAGFLEKVSLLDRDEPNRNDKENKLKRDAVVLMSLHSSKGLEFPHVFFVGLEEDLLPHKKSVGEGVDIEEERRLCYVGITRARQTLTLLNAARRKKFGKMQPRIPSRFLEEIPPELLNKVTSDTPAERSEVEKEKAAADFFAGIRQMLGD
jgi:DNA helicase-2/ATP-dependent DNA helicase PcrA